MQENKNTCEGLQVPEQPKSLEPSKGASQPNPKAVETNIRARIQELINVNRIIANGLNLIMDVNIKGGHAAPVAEFTSWLTGFNRSLAEQIKTLEGALPKKEEEKPTTVESPEAARLKVAVTKPVEPVAKPVSPSTEPDKKATVPVPNGGSAG